MRPRALKRRVAAACAGIILAGTGIGWAVRADADGFRDSEPFDWDRYVAVITGAAEPGSSAATSWTDLLLPPQPGEGGDR